MLDRVVCSCCSIDAKRFRSLVNNVKEKKNCNCYMVGRNARLSLVQIASHGIRQISLLTIQLLNK